MTQGTATKLSFPRVVVQSEAIYNTIRPVQWCPSCRKVLDEAEVTNPDHVCRDIYVRFDMLPESIDELTLDVMGLIGKRVSLVAWTTTPWSLPANAALAVNADVDYQFVDTVKGVLVVAKPLRAELLRAAGIKSGKVLGSVEGRRLERLLVQEPLNLLESPIVLSDHVLPTAGTGIVHIAPGLGGDDFKVGRAYSLIMICPFDDDGKLSVETGHYAGLDLNAADSLVIENLQEVDRLLASGKFERSYPHCSHCGTKVLDRIAVEQD